MSGEQTVFVKDQQGNILEGPASGLDAALKSGATQVSADEVAAQEKAEKYSGVGNTLAAGGLGALDMLSLGLGPAAVGAIGGQDTKDYIQGVTEAHPVAHGLGMAVGALAPALLTGGESLAAEAPEIESGLLRMGGRALAAPTNLVGDIGEGASALTRGVLGDGLIGRVAGGTARGLAEGGIYGAGNQIGEDILGDHELTAERLLAGAGRGMLLGGALSGGLSALGYAGERGLQKLADVGEGGLSEKIASKAEELRYTSTGAKAPEIRRLEAHGLTVNEAGRWGLDELPKFTENGKAPVGREAIREASQRAMDDATPRIQQSIDALDETGARPQIASTMDRLRNDVVKPLAGHIDPAVQAAGNRISTLIDNAEAKLNANPTFRQLFDLQKMIEQTAYDEPKLLSRTDVMKSFRKSASIIGDEIKQQGARAAGPEWLEGLEAAKRQFRMAKSFNDAVAGSDARIGGNRGISLTDTIAGAAGLAMGGPAGLAMGVGNHLLRKYGDAIGSMVLDKASKLQALQHMSLDFGDQTSQAVRAFLNSSHSSAVSTGVRVAGNYDSRKQEIQKLANNPELMTASLQHHMPPGDVAPKTAGLVATKASAAVQYLNSQLPQEVATRSVFTPQLTQKASKAAQQAWLRKLDVYEDPLSVLRDMAKGHLSPDKADAIKAMYPSLFSSIQQEIIGQIGEKAAKGKEPSFKARMQMGILFGVPTDATMDPGFLKGQQALYASPPPDADQIQQKAPGALANLDLKEASSEQTQSERLEAGNER